MAHTQSTKAEPKGWVVGQSATGPFIDAHGDPQDDLASAEVHDSEISARTFARRRTTQQMPGGTWRSIPLPSRHAAAPDDDEPYDQAQADANYARLARRPS